MAITTTIPTNLDFPNRGVLERDAFVLAQETAQDLLAGAYTTALNQYATELNSTQAEINLKAEQVYNQAVTGSYSQAYINATFTPKILNTQTDKATPIDADLIPLSDSASSFGLKKLSWLNIKATLKTYFDTLYMALTENQTIDGVKTFSTSPIVPTPTTGAQAVNKDYADLKVALASFTGTNQSKSANGYQKLPGGLIMQWGRTTTNIAPAATLNITFPVAFPVECFYSDMAIVSASPSNGLYVPYVVATSPSNLAITNNDTDSTITQIRWFAIGF